MTNTAEQALVALPSYVSVIIDSTLVCTPGIAEGCSEKLAGCVVEMGDVPIGGLARTLVTVNTTSRFDMQPPIVIGNCPDVYLELVPLVAPGEVQAFNVVVRPTAVGECNATLRIAVFADNLRDDVFDIPIASNRVAGTRDPGCYVDDACCCGSGASFPACVDDRVTCSAGNIAFDNRCGECTGGPTEALVRLDADVVTIAPGENAAVSWNAQGATSCTSFVGGTQSPAETAGSLTFGVDARTVAIIACDPAGPASIAALPFAPACSGEEVFDTLTIEGNEMRDALDQRVFVQPDRCIAVEGTLTVIDAASDLASRVTRAGVVHFVNPGTNGLDFVALREAALSFDYGSGIALPANTTLTEPYFSFPSLETSAGVITLAAGRVDLRARSSGVVSVDGQGSYPGPSAIDFADGALLDELVWMNTTAERAPVFTGSIQGIAGPLVIRDNPNLSADEVDKIVARFPVIEGAIIRCGNRDDAACE